MNAIFDYPGRKIFVAGGTSGINLGHRQGLRRGRRPVRGNRSQEKVDAAVAELSGRGRRWATPSTFATPRRSPRRLTPSPRRPARSTCWSRAGRQFPGARQGHRPNDFKAVVDIELLGTFNVMKAAYPFMRKCRGQRHQHFRAAGPGGDVAPGACLRRQGGVDMLTRCLAIEWGPEGLRVNGVVPGPDRGPRGHGAAGAYLEARDRAVASVPLRRMGAPDDVAAACLFLGSDAARYVRRGEPPGGRRVDSERRADGARLAVWMPPQSTPDRRPLSNKGVPAMSYETILLSPRGRYRQSPSNRPGGNERAQRDDAARNHGGPDSARRGHG